jgi:hypothetical protein
MHHPQATRAWVSNHSRLEDGDLHVHTQHAGGAFQGAFSYLCASLHASFFWDDSSSDAAIHLPVYLLYQKPFDRGTGQGYKCHKSNGVVFCFFNGRVFASCMDHECRRVLSLNMKAYYVMSKELEDVIFSNDLQRSIGSTLPGGCGGGGGSGSSSSARCADPHLNHLQSVLSQSQLDFLESVDAMKKRVVLAYHTSNSASRSPAPAAADARLCLRDFCKVPWR